MGVREQYGIKMVNNLLQIALKMQILKLNHGVLKNYH